jgi:crotonobetainyl-CoA:carnitine CoA-transferase CaiB-like acyl-CoA transferase
MSAPPLAHLRVVDLTDVRGAMAGRLLADLGADVVKIEPPGGDPDRWRPPFAADAPAPDRSLPFLFRHANKRGAVIDLADPAGRQRLAALCDGADILIENLGLDGQERYELSPVAVRRRHPHLIHVALADFGLSGPRARWRLEALPAFAASGALYASGFLDRPPCWLPGYTAHDCASTYGIVGALAALLDRHRHGRGQTVEVAVQDAALHGLYPWAVPLADYARLYPLLPPSPPRNADGNYLVLGTADGYVRVLPGTVRQWRAFVTLLGSPAALAGEEWENPVFRYLSTDVIRLVASEALATRRRAEVFAEALRLGVPAAPVNTPDEFVAEEQTRVRAYFQRTDFPHLTGAPLAPVPFKFSRTPVSLRRAAPALGEDRGGFPAAGQTGKYPSGEAVDLVQPPLHGMRVINLGVGAVGPEVGWTLLELGAEVIKIESRANLDFLRAVTIEPDTPNRAWTFNDESRGQRSVCLDLRTTRGRELALRLCATADVVVENNRGGVVRHWGLDYDDVRRARPDVIYLASQGFGRGGPLGEAPAFGPLNSCFAGTNLLWNHPDAPYPAGSALNHPDHIASKLGGAAILAALEHRRRTGEGQFIDLAQTEAAAYLLGEFYLEGPCTGRPAAPSGNAVPYAVPHAVYPCAGDDRWVAIAVVGDAAWERFARCLGWTPPPAWATLDGRQHARAEIDAQVIEWTRARSAEDVMTQLQEAGVSAMVVLSPDDLRADPQLAARAAIVTLEHPEIGPERHCANPIRMSRTRLATAGPAPLLGADTEAVLISVLGVSPDEVARLLEEGVCR